MGFIQPQALLLTAQQPSGKLPKGVKVTTWGSIYNWLQTKVSDSKWARELAAYLELMEARLTDSEQIKTGTLTLSTVSDSESTMPLATWKASAFFVSRLKTCGCAPI